MTIGFDDPKYLRWVSREEFFKRKDTDDFIRCVWSFGNDQRTYIYGKNIEPMKKALYYACVYDDWQYFNETTIPNEGVLRLKKSVVGIPLANWNERRLKIGLVAKQEKMIISNML